MNRDGGKAAGFSEIRAQPVLNLADSACPIQSKPGDRIAVRQGTLYSARGSILGPHIADASAAFGTHRERRRCRGYERRTV